jgi:hypothetical protein
MVCGRVGLVAKRLSLCVIFCGFPRDFRLIQLIAARKNKIFRKMEIIMKNIEKNVEIPSLMDEKTAAMLLSMSYEKLRKKVRPQNKIAYIRVGKSIKYTLADLKVYLARCRVEAKD